MMDLIKNDLTKLNELNKVDKTPDISNLNKDEKNGLLVRLNRCYRFLKTDK